MLIIKPILHNQGTNPDASAVDSTPVVDNEEDLTVREKRLQLKIQELTGALERVTQSAELRSQQSTELVNDVKKANA